MEALGGPLGLHGSPRESLEKEIEKDKERERKSMNRSDYRPCFEAVASWDGFHRSVALRGSLPATFLSLHFSPSPVSLSLFKLSRRAPQSSGGLNNRMRAAFQWPPLAFPLAFLSPSLSFPARFSLISVLVWASTGACQFIPLASLGFSF